jgi:hypothetical protein
MKRFMLAIVTSVTLGAPPIIAAGQHGPKAQPNAKSTHAPAPRTKPSTTKPTTGKPATAGKPVKSTTPAMKSPKTSTTTTTITKPATTTTVTLTPVQQKLQKNINLAAKLQSRLPAGTNLMTAADGFSNLGRFVAAVNVSHNLGIAFADLKTKLVAENFSLGQSIQSLKQVSSPTVEAQRAEYDARAMIADSERQPPVATKTKAKAKTSSGAPQK